jgi:hypothetical protein
MVETVISALARLIPRGMIVAGWQRNASGASIMKIVRVETLLSTGRFARSKEWAAIRQQVLDAVGKVDWPPGSGSFTIYPESGKKTGQGNGVKPIKYGLIAHLKSLGWGEESPLYVAAEHNPGDLDIVTVTRYGPFAVEWETGNISSSHRALNKMCLGLLKEKLVGGVLIVPTRPLYRFLTDRIGNWDELVPYLDLWRAVPIKEGVLQIIAVEHDATSTAVPRIPKGTEGRARG